ncbi:hypothetical protein [Micromonospora taraxaci]|uniref:hypothetical protein n=1 Tax=Micromonospora taraxaci TaxID=1316803 RepID=UPI0033B3FC65
MGVRQGQRRLSGAPRRADGDDLGSRPDQLLDSRQLRLAADELGPDRKFTRWSRVVRGRDDRCCRRLAGLSQPVLPQGETDPGQGQDDDRGPGQPSVRRDRLGQFTAGRDVDHDSQHD